jgi:hypothetical protein
VLFAVLGVIITAHTTLGGTKMIFRYPPVIRDKVSQATLREFEASKSVKADDVAESSSAAAGTGSAALGTDTSYSSPMDATESSDSLADANTQFSAFGMPSVELASLLMPKTPLSDAPFRVVVDNTKFIGHPTSIPARVRRARTAALSGAPSVADDGRPAAPRSASVLAVRQANNVDEDLSDSDEFDALASSGRVERASGAVRGGGGGGGGGGAGDGDSDSDSDDGAALQRVDITCVNVVFGLPVSDAQESEYHRIAAQIGTALRHEEVRCSYLSSQVHVLLLIRERWLADVAAAKPGQQPPTHSELYKRIVTESQLASELRHMYHSIRDFGVASLQFNNWINVFVSLRRVAIDVGVQHPLRPYQTLLLLDQRLAAGGADAGDAGTGGGSGTGGSGAKRAPLPLPPDVSPRLEALLDACRPTKSFRALQLETQIPLSQLFRLAAHLVYWRKARVIHMLTKNNVYMLKPDEARWKEQHRFLYRVAGEQVKLQADAAAVRKRDSVAVLCGKFARQFPSFRLPETLERFSTPKPLVEHMSQFSPTLQRDFVNVVVWLLRHNLLEQMFVYVFLMIPPPDAKQLDAAARDAATRVVVASDDAGSVLVYDDGTRQLMRARAADEQAAAAAHARLPSSSKVSDIRRNSMLATAPQPPPSAARSMSSAGSDLDWLEHGTPASGDEHVHELAAAAAANEETALFASAPSPLYQYEAQHIASLDDGSPQYRLLKRLCRYFRGTHHLEEIMWRENVDRIELLGVLEKYPGILLQCWQVEPNAD